MIVMLVLGVAAPTAVQASALCERLQDRLALVEQGGSTPEINSYASAIAQQNLELRKARQDQRRLRCLTSSIVQIRPDGGNDCGDLTTAISRMEENRDILAARLNDLRENRAEDARAALVTALEENGCGSDQQPLPEEAQRIPYLDTLSEPYQPDRAAEAAYSAAPLAMGVLPTGNVRTLCVRTCDGGFFPISSQTSAMNFSRDSAQCQQMCPGTETELFFHAPETSETVDMVSAVTGRSYRDLPNAFVYRNRRSDADPACSCNLKQYYQRMTPRPAVPDLSVFNHRGRAAEKGLGDRAHDSGRARTGRGEPESQARRPGLPALGQGHHRPQEPGQSRATTSSGMRPGPAREPQWSSKTRSSSRSRWRHPLAASSGIA